MILYRAYRSQLSEKALEHIVKHKVLFDSMSIVGHKVFSAGDCCEG
jgi:predicted  nucleic acid-binding Zn ribbon protein